MRSRSITDFPRNEQGLVDRFIGTAYDTVKNVYDALPELRRLDQIVSDIPGLGEAAVEAAMVPARQEIATRVAEAEEWADKSKASADAAALSAIEAAKTNQFFRFTYDPHQPIYDVTEISGLADTTTAGFALWVEGAIEYDYTILDSKRFVLNDAADYPDNAKMGIIVNARFDNLFENFDDLAAAFTIAFDRAQDQRDVEFQQQLANNGYEVPVPYTSGLVITRRTQTINYLSQDYRVNISYLPLTTSTWAEDSSKFLMIGNGTLREELTSNVNPGSSVVSYKQAGDNAVSRFIQDKLLEQAVSVNDFLLANEGANIRPALARMVMALKTNRLKSRVILIPFVPGEWTVDQTTLFDVSNFTLLLHGNVRLTGTTRQKTFLFATDNNMAPAAPLKNVTVLGNGAYVNGNATEMSFVYTHGDGSDNDSAIRFNYVDNLRVDNVLADNGPIDSMSTRQCRGKITGCRFTRSKEDNGFSATTDWDPVNWVYGDLNTYGMLVVEDCWAYDCEDFGMTAFNCSAVFFVNCRVWKCRGGFSYEDSFNSPDLKLMDGGFFGCWAFNCREQGFYITADCSGLDIFCKTWNIRGFTGDNTNGLYEHGVVVSNVKRIFIGGDHKKSGGCGVAVFNDTGYPMEVTLEVDIRDNDWHGVRGRGVGLLLIKSGSNIKRNGRAQVRGSFGSGVNISNSGGAPYLQGQGVVKIGDCFIDANGLNAVNVDFVKLVDVQSNICQDNAASASAVAIQVTNATTAKILDNQCPSVNAAQTFSVNIAATVLDGYEGGNSGSGSTGIISNNATRIRQSDRGEMYATAVYDPPSIAAGSQVATTVPVVGTTVGDFVTANFSSDPALTLDLVGVVSTDGNVTVYFRNRSAVPVDLGSGTLRVLVTKRNGG